MAANRSIVAGTAGHIDHGKTTLIKALTGVNTDRLGEEQKRGITIELGFAPLDLEDIHIGFVDVPGHEKFVKNMLAGAGGIDVMLLVVAADESVMPQTREHVEICRLLGISQAVAAVTKTDQTDEDSIELVTLETQELLEDNGFNDIQILPVSGTTGQGLDELKAALVAVARVAEARQYEAQPRLPVDRVFTMKGHGTVVTGTLISGHLESGAKLHIFPSQLETTVKSLQVHGEKAEAVQAGHRVAINLANVGTSDLDRGQVLAPPDALPVADTWDVECTMLETSPCALEQNMRVRVHAGAAEVLARASLPGGTDLPAGERGIVRLRFEEPVSGYIGDRIVLRRYSPMVTIAGAVILDNAPPLLSANRREALEQLQGLMGTGPQERFRAVLAQLPRPVTLSQLIQRFGYSSEKLKTLLEQEEREGTIHQTGQNPAEYCSRSFFSAIRGSITSELKKLHTDSPLKPGFPRNSLKPSLPKQTSDSAFTAALVSLEKENLIQQMGGQLCLADHEIILSAEQEAGIKALEEEFRAAAFAPPSPAQAIKKLGLKDGEELFDLLISKRQVRLVAQDYFLHADTLENLRSTLAERAGSEPFAVPQFKDWLGISRKYAIPLLEYLDHQGITYRKGDERYLNR